MHETLHPHVKGYIDQQKAKGNSIFIKGWCFHYKLGNLPLRFLYNNSEIIDVDTHNRTDVFNTYKRSEIIHCGWQAVIPQSIFGYLQMNIDNQWCNIFPFNTGGQPPISENNHSLDTSITNDINPPRFAVVDNFYKNPDSVRDFALGLNFVEHKSYHKGKRTDECYRFEGLKEAFEKILGVKIINWDKYGTNGCFQYCIGGDQLVYHCDGQQYAGLLYLSPDAPPQTGTSFYRSKHTKKMKVATDGEHNIVFKNGYLDSTEFDLVDTVGNVYNRLVLFDAKLIHAASEYFGNNVNNGRLFQLFFFDIEGYDRVN